LTAVVTHAVGCSIVLKLKPLKICHSLTYHIGIEVVIIGYEGDLSSDELA
jgi:hypothetical protein